jgi:transposase-like protein
VGKECRAGVTTYEYRCERFGYIIIVSLRSGATEWNDRTRADGPRDFSERVFYDGTDVRESGAPATISDYTAGHPAGSPRESAANEFYDAVRCSRRGDVLKQKIGNKPDLTIPAAKLAAIKGDRTLAELAEQFDVHPNWITTWKAQLENRAADIFSPNGTTTALPAIDVKALHAKIDELTLENDFFKGRAHQGGMAACRFFRKFDQRRLRFVRFAADRAAACSCSIWRTKLKCGAQLHGADGRRAATTQC